MQVSPFKIDSVLIKKENILGGSGLFKKVIPLLLALERLLVCKKGT